MTTTASEAFDIPRLESLFELESFCQPGKPDAEFWRAIALGAANELCVYSSVRREEWETGWPMAVRDLGTQRYFTEDLFAEPQTGPVLEDRRDFADSSVTSEINLYIKRILGGDSMATGTLSRKTKAVETVPDEPLSYAMRDHGLRMLLCPTPGEAMNWAALKGESDESINLRLRSLWTVAIKRTKPLCCASAFTGSPMVWLGQDHVRGTPTLSGDELIDNVRRLMNLGEASAAEPDFETIKKKGKGPPKTKPAAEKVSAAELLAGVEVIDERDVPYADIKRSAENPRTSFDATLITEMAPTIESICRLNPLTIREGTNELIDGETRHRAGDVGKAKTLRCKIVRCTDAQAAAIRLLTSLQRRDLNPIERAHAIKSLQEKHGLSQRQLSDLVKLEQGSISNLTRLLDLPDAWQQRVISGEIAQAVAREIVPWCDVPELMKELAVCWKEKENWQDGSAFTAEDMQYMISDCIDEMSDEVPSELKLTDEQQQALGIRKHRHPNGRTVNITFNKKMLAQIVDERDRQRNAKELQKLEKKAGASPSAAATAAKPTAAEKKAAAQKAAENKKKQAQIVAKRLYRFRTAWYQACLRNHIAGMKEAELFAVMVILTTVGERSGYRGGELYKLTKAGREPGYGASHHKLYAALMKSAKEGTIWEQAEKMLAIELEQKFEGYSPVLQPEEIEAIADYFEFDIGNESQWQGSFSDAGACKKLWENFQDLWSKDQILELLAEWKVPLPEKAASMKRDDLAKLLKPDHGCPKSIINVKPVRLV